jgi:hypothetical protein
MPLLKQTFLLILEPAQKVPPRQNVLGEIQRVAGTTCALKIRHESLHKYLGQCRSHNESPTVPQDNVISIHIPITNVQLRQNTTTKHALQTLQAVLGRQAMQGIRRKLGHEF